MTNGAGALVQESSARAGAKPCVPANGHGTRASHPATAQTTSATPAPNPGRRLLRLQSTNPKPIAIAAAHCVPALRQQLAHRIVLALVDVDLARVGHQRGAAGERFDRPRAAGDGGRGRQARLRGERAGGAPAVERRREQHARRWRASSLPRHRHPTPARRRPAASRAPRPSTRWRSATASARRRCRRRAGSDRGRARSRPRPQRPGRCCRAARRCRPAPAGAAPRPGSRRPAAASRRRAGHARSSAPARAAAGSPRAPATTASAHRTRPRAAAPRPEPAKAAQISGSAGSGRPATTRPLSAKRWSRPSPRVETRSNWGRRTTIAATTHAVSTSHGTAAARRRRGRARTKAVGVTVFASDATEDIPTRLRAARLSLRRSRFARRACRCPTGSPGRRP